LLKLACQALALSENGGGDGGEFQYYSICIEGVYV